MLAHLQEKANKRWNRKRLSPLIKCQQENIVMVIIVGKGHGDLSSYSVCISYDINTFGEKYESNSSPSSYR